MFFLQRIRKKLGKPLTSIADNSLRQLFTYNWPGNIRELEHVLERAAIVSQTAMLELAEPLRISSVTSLSATSSQPVDTIQPIQQTMRGAILAALAKSGHRIRGRGGAAELLNLKPTTLEARMKKLNIRVPSK